MWRTTVCDSVVVGPGMILVALSYEEGEMVSLCFDLVVLVSRLFVTCWCLSWMPEVLNISMFSLWQFFPATSMIYLVSSSRAMVAASCSFSLMVVYVVISADFPPCSTFWSQLFDAVSCSLMPTACLSKRVVMSSRVSQFPDMMNT